MKSDFPNDPEVVEITFSCLRARQPIGDLFIASIPYKKLQKITYYDVRRVIEADRDVERYLGIQRPLDGKRVAQLKKYVEFADASFPTSVILAIDQDYVFYDENSRLMTISNHRIGEKTPSTNISRVAKVIDGQHRIDGLSSFSGDQFDLSVTIFVGADVADQAQIFATVNLEQTKVNKSLVYDLYELSRTRSPQKTCHNITVTLDSDNESPLYHRIKRLGLSTFGREFEPVTQATFVDRLIEYISKDPKGDRDALLRGRKLLKLSGEELNSVPFRNMFIDEKDIDITEIVYNYFCAVRDRWPVAWLDTRPGHILNRTNGIRALLRFLRIAYLDAVKLPGEVPKREKFREILNKISISDEQFTIENFVPGTGGEAKLLNVFRGKENI